jgi:type IV pilus assembly protein PilW
MPIKIPSQQGFSLLETLLAAFLGLILISGLLEVYLSIKTIYPLQDALARMQENGRFALHFLRLGVREAGYVGCANTTQPVQHNAAIQGYNSQNLPADWKKQAAPNTDMLIIKKCTFTKNKNQVVDIAYFIGNTGRRNQKGEPIFGLYEKIDSQPRSELIAGVENLHIQYGVSDTQGQNVVKYSAANQLSTNDWLNVRSVNMMLLLNSIEEVTQKPESYIFAGVSVAPKDRLLHREWQAYITLRERE